jgi:hypothetical protein
MISQSSCLRQADVRQTGELVLAGNNKGDLAKRATEMVLRTQRGMGASDAYVRNELAVFGGTLLTVTFKADDGRQLDNFVFHDGKHDHYFYNPNELARFIDGRRPVRGLASVVRELGFAGGAASVIALLIAITLCYLAVSKLPIPDVLQQALTTVLGFYFGSKAARRSDPPAG